VAIKPKQSGFTLIELIFVVLMIALLSSFTLPKVSNMAGFNLKSGATQMAGYLRSAYEESVLRHKRVRVRFDLANARYWAESYEEGSDLIPLIDEETKIDDVLEKFEKRSTDGKDLSDEEKMERESERYKKVEGGSLAATHLPHDIKFKGIFTSTEGKLIADGTPWVDFTPGGFAPKTIVYVMNDREQLYSIILQPLGGRTRIERGEVRPDES
jgi:prepilin-type N-terminal cleavage/methylation domain-containing protein